MITQKQVEYTLNKLLENAERDDYSGYDIYDGLKITESQRILNNVYANTLITQFFKKCPVNFRKLAGIQKSRMPKTLGIFLKTYCNMSLLTNNDEEKKIFLDKARAIKNDLIKLKLNSYSGACWNFGFKYKMMFDTPTIVITAIIVKALFDYYKISGDEETKKILVDIKNFIIKDLHHTVTKEGICFSYTPKTKDCTYNASMLAAETLSIIYSITRDDGLIELIASAVDFVLEHRQKDGRWNYSININNGAERKQVDFHQGYVLESLFNIINLAKLEDKKYLTALSLGTNFYYQNQFYPEGRSRWRFPADYPVDIHNQAQGIITFSLLKHLHPRYFDFARTIAEWTIQNMFDEKGYFYYQVNKLCKNKINYMRWSQAWMALALSTLLTKEIGK